MRERYAARPPMDGFAPAALDAYLRHGVRDREDGLPEHLLAFEVLSILLLAAMIGAIVLARRADPARRSLPTRRREA